MGKAVIFCAPSGAGKTTIVKQLIKQIPSLRFSISATTRQPRDGVEKHGKDYYFLSEEEFRSHRMNDELLEWEEVYPGTFYGTLKSEVDRIWAEGNHVIFDVDVIGGMNLKESLREKALAVFVSVESLDVLRQRLERRQTETPESIEERVGKAAREMQYANSFDYILVNRDLDTAFTEAEKIVKDFLQ